MVKPTIAKGIIGVRTSIESMKVITELQTLYEKDHLLLRHTSKWVPVDLWTHSDMDSMREAVVRTREKIEADEKWRRSVEKRRFTLYHKIEVIRELAELINGKVDLKNPNKILRLDIIGRYAGISVFTPNEIFSIMKLHI